MGARPTCSQIYGNWTVEAPNGQVLFRCNEKKANWYLSRGLAALRDKKTMRLTFDPRGPGDSRVEHLLDDRHEICVVCGKTNGLSRHHVVPHCYRRFFPEADKSRNSFDVMPLCVKCHDEYEQVAMILKKSLAGKYDAPLSRTMSAEDKEAYRISSVARALVKCDKIPATKRVSMLEIISSKIGKPISEITHDDLEAIPPPPRVSMTAPHGQVIVEKMGVKKIGMLWRQHFMAEMEPKFLPRYWHIGGRQE
jgi:hypothetical protein